MRAMPVLSLVVFISGCSLIRVQGLPFGGGSSAPSSSSAATAPPPPPFSAPVTVKVPAQGVVLRVASDGVERCSSFEVGAPFAIVEVPPGEWIIEADDGHSSIWFLTEQERASGRCGGGSARTSLAPGRYLVGFNSPARNRHTFSIHPEKDVDPLLHAEVPAELPVEERVVGLWFPFFSAATPASLLAVMPRQLFVYAPSGSRAHLETASNAAFRFGQSSSSSNQKPPVVTVQPDEALLRLESNKYLTTDLSIAFAPSSDPAMLAAPSGPVPLPAVRNAWAPDSELLPGPTAWVSGTPLSEEKVSALPAPLQKDVRAYYKDLDRAIGCTVGARNAWEAATTNVILTASQRRAIDLRRERDDAACKPAYASIERLKARIVPQLAARRVEALQREADLAKPHLQQLFAP